MTKGFKKGSIITISCRIVSEGVYEKIVTEVKTISVINKVIGDHLYCKHSIVSIDGEDYVDTKSKYKSYEGELAGEGVRLCNSDEFDVVIDSRVIPRKQLINVN